MAPPRGFEPWKAHGETELTYWKRQYFQQAEIIGLIPLESLRLCSERLDAGCAKHGDYHALPVIERLAKIGRHLAKAQAGQRDEEHIAAIACNALLALEQRRRDQQANPLDRPSHHDPLLR